MRFGLCMCYCFLTCFQRQRYDGSGADLAATAGADGTVKVWDTSTGMLRANFRAGTGNAIFSCDISNGIVAGGGSDKTCRIWNLRTQRMVSG